MGQAKWFMYRKAHPMLSYALVMQGIYYDNEGDTANAAKLFEEAVDAENLLKGIAPSSSSWRMATILPQKSTRKRPWPERNDASSCVVWTPKSKASVRRQWRD